MGGAVELWNPLKCRGIPLPCKPVQRRAQKRGLNSLDPEVFEPDGGAAGRNKSDWRVVSS